MYGFLSTASLADVNESDLHVWQSEVPTPLRTEKGGGGGGRQSTACISLQSMWLEQYICSSGLAAKLKFPLELAD